MIVNFDKLNRLETPKMTLCNPGSQCINGKLTRVVGVLTNTEAEEIVFNFNATSELNFRINNITTGDTANDEYLYSLYRGVQNRRLIFVDDIGYFCITDVRNEYSDGVHYKDVTAQSIDIELEQRNIPYIQDGTYALYINPTEGAGILNIIADSLPMWEINANEIDQDLIGRYDDQGHLLGKYRTFEDVDTGLNCLGFLIENVQDAFECIIVFDIVNRKICAYDESTYLNRHKTDIHLTNEDVINSIDITENSNDVYTAIRVMGGDESVTIAAANPLRGNVIYNFDYYLDWMSPSLGSKVIAWNADIISKRPRFLELSEEYYEIIDDINNDELEINRLNILIDMYRRASDNMIANDSMKYMDKYNDAILANGGTPIIISQEVQEAKTQILALIAQCLAQRGVLQEELNLLYADKSLSEQTIEDLVGYLNINTYFASEMQELQNYIYEGNYTDEYIITTDVMSSSEKFNQMKILYDRAVTQLEKISKPIQEFSIDVENFVFAKDFERWSNQLETGCSINVELGLNDVQPLFLSTITINYDDHTLSLTFGGKINKFDPKSLFENVLGSVSRSANSVSYLKGLTQPIKNGQLDDMQVAIQNSRNITMSNALSAEAEGVMIDEGGYTGKSVDADGDDSHQIKITGRNIVFTDDSWDSSKTAIGDIIYQTEDEEGQPTTSTAYGINAELLIGDMVIGNGLRIQTSDGEDLESRLSALDGKIETEVSNVNTGLSSRIEQLEKDVQIEINSVTTSTGFKFDEYGLHISESGSDISNNIDKDGMTVSRTSTGEEMLRADVEGVEAYNITIRKYLKIGNNCRFEDFVDDNDEPRTACFFTGQ